MRKLHSTGDFPPNPIAKSGYTLVFNDGFDQDKIDTTKWFPHFTPHWSSRARTRPNYTFEDNALILQITETQAACCPEFDGEVRASVLQTGAYAGPVGSKIGQLQFSDALIVREAQTNVRLYTPQYGYFETRVKGCSAGGVHVSLWMMGYEDQPDRCGEICLFELLGNESGSTTSKVRYGIHPFKDSNLEEEFFVESFAIDSTQFHIYAVEWTPTHVDFFIDNVKTRTVNQSPQYPMQFMLGIFELPFDDGWNGPYDPDAPYPKTFTVDYVRGYQPIDGYSS